MNNTAALANFARQRILQLYDHADYEELFNDTQRYWHTQQSHCMHHVLNCLSYGFNKVGDFESAQRVWLHAVEVLDLAAYLIHQHHWACIYINPDVINPPDGQVEHQISYSLASKSHTYYGLPVSFMAVNYNPTPDASCPTQPNTADLERLNLIDFGLGLSRGNMHTWVFSKGEIYELPWQKWYHISNDEFDKTCLTEFPWLNGAIIVPPETARLLAAEGLSCV